MNLPKKPTSQTTFSGRQNTARVNGLAIVGLVLVATLAGCANYSKRHFTVGAVSDDYRSRHPIVISEKEQTLDIPVASNSRLLPDAEVSAVEGFAYQFIKTGSRTMTVLVPSGSGNARAAARIAKQVTAVLQTNGIARSQIIKVPYTATEYGNAAPVRLSYASIQASVDGCGQWPEDLASEPENKNYQNFGCASQNNLASIIANPSDLLGPRGSTPIDAERRLQVIDAYRNARNPATNYESE